MPRAGGSLRCKEVRLGGGIPLLTYITVDSIVSVSIMKRKSLHSIEWVLFIVCAAALLLAGGISGRYAAETAVSDALPEPVLEPRDRIYGVAVVDDGTVWMAGSNGKVVRCVHDGGCMVQQTGTVRHLQDIAAWDARRAVAVGNNGLVIVTRDGGASWKKVSTPRSEISNKLFKVHVYPGGRAWAVGEMGMILRSDTWGETWQRRSDERDLAWNDILFTDTLRGWVVGEFGSIMQTVDGGMTWCAVPSPVQSSLTAIAFKDRLHGVIAGLSGTILTTIDGGLSWHKVSGQVTQEHLLGLAWDGAEWFSVGTGGVLVRGDSSGRQWRADRLSAEELLWHSDIAVTGARKYIVGGTQGTWEKGRWKLMEYN